MSQAPYQLLRPKGEAFEEGYPTPQGDSGHHRSRSWSVYYTLLAVAAAAAVGFLCGKHQKASQYPISAAEVTPQISFLKKCPSNLPLLPSPPAKINPWAPLSLAEIQDIKIWLFDANQNLNLTEGLRARDSDNIVYLIETYPPTKDDALAFLDSPGPAPDRYARVTIDHGGLQEPVTRDYLVGPLPVSKKTKIRRLKEIYHREDIPFNARGMTDVSTSFEFFAKAVAPMADAIQDLFGGKLEGNPLTDTFIGGISGGWGFDGSFRRVWISWKINGPGSWIQPVNFYNYLDLSGSDPSQWKVLKVVYHNQTFPSVTSFLEAYINKTLVRFPRPTLPTAKTAWASRKRTGAPRDLDHLPGPRSVSFAGPRFRIDKEQGYISWLGWAMYLSFDRDMGLSLWDVRFKGERIIYQLAPQDCLVQYSGHDPVQSVTSWLDRYFGMGMATRDLLPNYDCPQNAVYLPSALYHPLLGVVKRERAICVFEMDTGKPLTRHFGEWPGETGAVKGYVLTVRSTASLGNYDYLFDYVFHLDGTIEVKVSASGYLQGGYWNPEQEGYGSRIHQHSMGNVHDHVINFKVDLDVAGRDNTFRKASAHIESVYMPWLDDDDWRSDSSGKRELLQQKIKYTYIDNEDDARVTYSPNYREGYAIINLDQKNEWGSERGYAIHPGLSPIHNNLLKSQRLLNNANWASHHLAVSRRKDTEPSSSSMWNLNLPSGPPVDFDKFFDGENIEQEDLVLWINVGTHHQPVAEDVPNTKTNIASSSFFLTPVNYFDSDPSMELLNAIVVDPIFPEAAPPSSKSPSKRHADIENSHAVHLPAYEYDDNGVEQHFHCTPEAPARFSYDAQVGLTDDLVGNMDAEDLRSWMRRVQGIMDPFVLRFGP